jgi:hypothetical protein
MRRLYKDGTSVKTKVGINITLSQARPTWSNFILGVPAGPFAGASSLNLGAGSVGCIESISHGAFQGWYIVKFPLGNGLSISCDFEQDALERAK